ncbi:hypothetical protein F2P81_016519 [Scophthalmus maximus]|nr:hypothetical protein F2P81_016519 [Scophthalmus maximus]
MEELEWETGVERIAIIDTGGDQGIDKDSCAVSAEEGSYGAIYLRTIGLENSHQNPQKTLHLCKTSERSITEPDRHRKMSGHSTKTAKETRIGRVAAFIRLGQRRGQVQQTEDERMTLRNDARPEVYVTDQTTV